MPRLTGHKQSARILVAVLVGVALAGCTSGPANDPTPSTQNGGSSIPTSSTTPSEGPPFHFLKELHLSQYVMILEPVENRTVRAFQTQTQMDDASDSCQGLESDLQGPDYYWYNVWNRTGLVNFEQVEVDWNKPLDVSFALPNDPPFLVWVSMTCLGKYTLEFNADEYRIPSGCCPGNYDEQPDPIAYGPNVTHRVVIPPGETRGVVDLRIVGEVFHIEIAARSRTTESGQRYGDLYVYEPNEDPEGDGWFIHAEYTPLGSDLEMYHGEVGMPGTYQWVVELATPTVEETVWTISTTWLYEFLPRIQEYGFEYPFELYDDRWTYE